MQDEAYSRLVAEEVKNRVSAREIDYLKLDYKKWQQALLGLVENLNGQINKINGDAAADEERFKELGDAGTRLIVEAKAMYSDRCAKARRFLFHVERRLDEVTRIIGLGEDASDERLQLVEFLSRAIEKHRELSEAADYVPNAIDNALWASLEGKWLFEDIDMEAV